MNDLFWIATLFLGNLVVVFVTERFFHRKRRQESWEMGFLAGTTAQLTADAFHADVGVETDWGERLTCKPIPRIIPVEMRERVLKELGKQPGCSLTFLNEMDQQ